MKRCRLSANDNSGKLRSPWPLIDEDSPTSADYGTACTFPRHREGAGTRMSPPHDTQSKHWFSPPSTPHSWHPVDSQLNGRNRIPDLPPHARDRRQRDPHDSPGTGSLHRVEPGAVLHNKDVAKTREPQSCSNTTPPVSS